MARQTSRWSGVNYDALASPQRTYEDADELARERHLASLRLRAPNAWLSDHLGESQRLTGAVYLAVRCLGDQASQAELSCYRWHEKARAAGDEEAKEYLPADHPLPRLLNFPNNRNTRGMLLKRKVQQLCLTGTALEWMVTEGPLDIPTELWSVPTGTYQPVAPSVRYPEGAYRIQPWFPGPLAMVPGAWSAGGVIVDARHILATRHPHPLVEHEGLSPLSACDLPLDTIEAIDRARASTMRQLVNPSAVAETDIAISNPDPNELSRVREELRQLLYGKSGGVAALPAGMHLNKWDAGTVEIGWIESWSQLLGFVLSVFGLTKSLAFLDDDVSFAQLYASIKQADLFTFCPLLNMLADAWNLQLVWPVWGEDYCVELKPQKVTNDEEDRAKADLAGKYRIATNNEARAWIGLPKIKEPWGEERVGDVGEQGKPPPGEAEPGAGLAGGKPGVEERRKEDKQTSKERPGNTQGRGSLPGRQLLNGAGKH